MSMLRTLGDGGHADPIHPAPDAGPGVPGEARDLLSDPQPLLQAALPQHCHLLAVLGNWATLLEELHNL